MNTGAATPLQNGGDAAGFFFRARDQTTNDAGSYQFYIYALSNDNKYILEQINSPCTFGANCTKFVITRSEDSNITTYEVKFPAHSLGRETLTEDLVLDVGVIVMDSDNVESFQEGYSGYSPHAVLHMPSKHAAWSQFSAGPTSPLVLRATPGMQIGPPGIPQWRLPKRALGCVDPEAVNYNAVAVAGDGSCIYDCSSASTIAPCLTYDGGQSKWDAALQATNSTTPHLTIRGVPPAILAPKKAAQLSLPRFELCALGVCSPQTSKHQSLVHRYMRVAGTEVFGGGGKNLGAVLSLHASTYHARYVDFVRNKQYGVGAGAIFAVSSNLTISFAVFEGQENLALGAGAVALASQSHLTVLHTQFSANEYNNIVGAVDSTISASCLTVDDSSLYTVYSAFEQNKGNVIVASAASAVDAAHSMFKANQGISISLSTGSVGTITSCTFAENIITSSDTTTGAILTTDTGTMAHIYNSSFTSNTAVARLSAAGALYARDGAVMFVTSTEFVSNVAQSQVAAGAIFGTRGSNIALTDVKCVSNQADPYTESGTTLIGAGALYSEASTTSITRTLITNNKATGATAITSYNYAEALFILSPRSIYVKDSNFAPLLEGGKTVTINPGSDAGVTQGSCQQVRRRRSFVLC
jgi:hypothetical protein